MNEKYSSKREGRPMGGQLSWITAGNTIQPFEDALYSLELGEVSYPVRSQFGYHLILLQEKRPRTLQRLVKHIFVQRKDDGTGQQKINQAFVALEADSSWSDVLQNYTEDPSSIDRDGSLGWVGYGGRFPGELIDAAIQTSVDIAYSEPYEMSYGYHIIQVDSIRTFTSEGQKEEFILNRLKELGRLNPNQQDVFERIAKKSDLNINLDNFSQIISELRDSTSLNTNPEIELIQFNNKTFTSSDFKYWLDHIASVEDVMESGSLIESYRIYILEQNYVDYTRNRFPEFAEQVDHFLEGLIVFKVNEENIWNPEAVDRSKLQAFYESNRNDYKQGKTFLYTEISAASDSIMQVVHKELSNGTRVKELSKQFDRIAIYEDSTSYSQNPAYPTLETLQTGEFSEPVSVNDRVIVYILNQVKSERIVSFEEAYDRVFTDYQPIREENYNNKLKQRYNLQLYPENLN
jgi:peptidyl-prolyl cis-trans isomerase SurA